MHEAYVSFFQPHRHFAPVNVLKQPVIDQSMPPSHNQQKPFSFRSSSSIGSPQNELQTMKDFFDWKVKKTIHESIIRKLLTVRQIVENKEFKFKHLKAMFDPINLMHRRAIELDISDGMALDFAEDLKQFKQTWRSAQGLMGMRFDDGNWGCSKWKRLKCLIFSLFLFTWALLLNGDLKIRNPLNKLCSNRSNDQKQTESKAYENKKSEKPKI